MNRLAGFAHSLLRIVSGFLFIHPGGMKLLGWFGGMPHGVEMTPLLVTAGVIELVCGTLIFLGLLTRPAAFKPAEIARVRKFNEDKQGARPPGQAGSLT